MNKILMDSRRNQNIYCGIQTPYIASVSTDNSLLKYFFLFKKNNIKWYVTFLPFFSFQNLQFSSSKGQNIQILSAIILEPLPCSHKKRWLPKYALLLRTILIVSCLKDYFSSISYNNMFFSCYTPAQQYI